MGAEIQQILKDGSHFGDYTVLRPLGRGGMGEVYLVQEPVAGEYYAVKVLHAIGPDDTARFIREANFAMNTRHPNLVEVYDAGKDPDSGLCYMTMEYMPHGSLRDAIEAGGALPLGKVASIAADIAAALAVIDTNGLVHRDVKPGNILLAADGTAKLSDLGITRAMAPAPADVNLTQAEDVVGTPAYMAPEQMLDSRNVDARADIYSLGVVIFEMLAGKRPNEGESAMTTLARALDGRPPPDVREYRRDCPAPLARLVSMMMSPKVEDRPANAREVLWLLAHPNRLAAGPAVVGGRAAEPPRPRWYEDRSLLYAFIALVISLEVLVVAIMSVVARR